MNLKLLEFLKPGGALLKENMDREEKSSLFRLPPRPPFPWKRTS